MRQPCALEAERACQSHRERAELHRPPSLTAEGRPARLLACTDLAALIPALDCETTLGELVEATRRHLPRVLVVDDGSADRSADVAQAAGAEVLRLPRNRGKAAALRTGMQALRDRGVTHALTLDADGQHLPGEIPALREAAAAHPAAIVIGARRHEPGSMTPVRLFGNRFASRWVEIACGRALEDTQSGFRVYPLPRPRSRSAVAPSASPSRRRC